MGRSKAGKKQQRVAKTTAKTRSYERALDRSIAITPVEYTGLQKAYDHFNAELFDGTLGDVFITYQRQGHSRGYFSADRFSGRVDEFGRHEIALNPDHFVGRSDEDICSTLCHEQLHHSGGTLSVIRRSADTITENGNRSGCSPPTPARSAVRRLVSK